MNRSEPAEKKLVLRTLDANLNRATEALRVLEDVARFCFDDEPVCASLKRLRHTLVDQFAEHLPSMLSARDTARDVGTSVSTEAEFTRQGISDIAMANFSRLRQALRCLEEFGKVVDPVLGHHVEQVRYSAYSMEQSFTAAIPKLPKISGAQLYVLIHGDEDDSTFRERVDALVAAKIDVIQLRAKEDNSLSDRELLERSRILVASTRGSDTLSIVNDRPDIAMASEADGVHLGQDEMPIKMTRRIVGHDFLIGVSTHSIAQAREAEQHGADYIGVGPMFPSTTKSFAEFPGVPLLNEIQNEVEIPAFAIGGINLENLDQITAAGCRRIALQSAFAKLSEIESSADKFRALLDHRSYELS